jgi:U4/U6 small nuclear ribonucleoprotein PRP4
MLTMLGPGGQRKRGVEAVAVEKDEKTQEVWYHAGPPELSELRSDIAGYSLRRARDRLASARVRLSLPDSERNPHTTKLQNSLRTFGNYASQVGDTRPLSFCQFSPNSEMLATSSWTGLCKLWSVPDCKEIKTLKGHTERVGAVVWHPESGISQDPAGVNLVSCDAAGAVKCWSMESDEPIASLEGHSQRVPRVAFHPSGRLLGTTCYDKSWRLWDMTTQQEVLHQEGHSRPVYDIAFHPDGSLVGTGAEDALGRIWDLRSGKCIMTLQGHVQKVLGIDFSANGYHVATGSEDHTMRLWDLRQQKSVYTMPSHKGLISHIKYQKDGDLLVSASFSFQTWVCSSCYLDSRYC